MKDLILIVLAIVTTATLLITSLEYSKTTSELLTIERIENISNNITNDEVNNELSKLSDETLMEVLGL